MSMTTAFKTSAIANPTNSQYKAAAMGAGREMRA